MLSKQAAKSAHFLLWDRAETTFVRFVSRPLEPSLHNGFTHSTGAAGAWGELIRFFLQVQEAVR